MQITQMLQTLRNRFRTALRTARDGSQAGMSLVESSIVLATAAIIGGSVATVGMGMLDNARMVAARDDVAELAAAVYRLSADQGNLVLQGAEGARIELLAGPGDVPQADGAAAALARPIDGRSVVALTDVLYDNSVALPLPQAVWMQGWRGPYIQPDAGSDPWGRRYVVNLGSDNGAVYVLSAGPDGIVQSQPGNVALRLGGDDIVHVLGGARR